MYSMRQDIYLKSFSVLLILSSLQFGSPSLAQETSESFYLSDTIRHQYTGFRLLSSEKKEALLKAAKTYVGIRRGSLKRSEQNRFQDACEKEPESSPFCTLLNEP